MSGRFFYSYAVCGIRGAFRGDSLATSRYHGGIVNIFGHNLSKNGSTTGHGTAILARGTHNPWQCYPYGTHTSFNAMTNDANNMGRTTGRGCGHNRHFGGHGHPPFGLRSKSLQSSISGSANGHTQRWSRRLHTDPPFGHSKKQNESVNMSTPKNRQKIDPPNSHYTALFNRNKNFRYIALVTGATFALSRSSDDGSIHNVVPMDDHNDHSGEVLDDSVPINFGDPPGDPSMEWTTAHSEMFHEDIDSPDDESIPIGYEVPITFNEGKRSIFSVPAWTRIWHSIKEHWKSAREEWQDAWNEGTRDGKVVSLEPLWVILGNTCPTTFGNAFMITCGSIFTLWKLGENMRSSQLTAFLHRHFLASYDALKGRRYHTFLTSAISHTSLLHIGLNFMMFHQLISTFHSNMHRNKGVTSSLDELVNSIFSSLTSSVSSLTGGLPFWGPAEDSQNERKYGRVTTNDIFNVMVLSSIVSSFGHVYLYRTPVLGASGAISGLTYLLASTFPNSFFRTVFPLPGLHLSILQVCQLFVATNVYFLMSGSSKGIAWAAHLMGMGAGALYCWFQQNVNRRPGFYNPITLSIKTARQQWVRTFKGIGRL